MKLRLDKEQNLDELCSLFCIKICYDIKTKFSICPNIEKKGEIIMKINEALKDERIKLGLTQEKFVKGIFTASNYSKIELGQQGIDSDDLFKLLAANKINFEDFALKLREEYISYESRNVNLQYRLATKLRDVFYQKDVSQIDELDATIQSSDVSQEVKIRSVLIKHILKNTVDKIDSKTKQKVKQILFTESSWVKSESRMRLFVNSMIVFDGNELDYYIYQLIQYYAENDMNNIETEELVAGICVNYVFNRWTKKLKYVSEVLNLLEKVPMTPEVFVYKIIGRYLDDILKDNQEDAKEIARVLSKYGLSSIAKLLPKEK